MRRFRSTTAVAFAAGSALAVTLLSGCNGGATTVNGVTPGPPLPSGVTLPPGAAHFQYASSPAVTANPLPRTAQP